MNVMRVICDFAVCKAAGLALRIISKVLNVWPLGIWNLRERWNGISYFRHHIMPKEFDWKFSYGKMSKSFRKYGFKVPQLYSDCYSQWNGIVHDRYLSTDLYYNYILPCLNRYDFMMGLLDKAFAATLFSDINRPRTVVSCRNGIFFNENDLPISIDEAVADVVRYRQHGKIIIKPTTGTACATGVGLLKSENDEGVRMEFAKAGLNFICQEKVMQHVTMARLNTSSLNTLRVYTYRDLGKRIHFVEEASIVRFGGAGAVFDNALAGGGYCAVDSDGNVSDRICREGTFSTSSLEKEKGLTSFKIPDFQNVKDFVLNLHSRLPYFDWVGWDVAIKEEGDVVFIEFNLVPSCELPQTAHGDIFGPYFDEIMQRAQKVKHTVQIAERQDWGAGFRRLEGVVTW